jgi:hypothetical protein
MQHKVTWSVDRCFYEENKGKQRKGRERARKKSVGED